ncbi:MAG TPA: ABC transporter permease [Candidatus Paceibacterota bacterium]|jgi:putative ABC transport system permease protein|nr:ABC transporter permease [Candidatus Paceibacterota bacterium]
MKSNYILKTAFQALKSNRSRTFLTLLGVTIGVASIIMVMSVGEGAQNIIIDQIEGLGSNMLTIMPGQRTQGISAFAQIYLDSLTKKDIELLKLKSNVPDLEEISPLVYTGANFTYGKEAYQSMIAGGAENLSTLFDVYPQEGSFFTKEDVENNSNVVIIGSKIKKELFGLSNPIGERIKINNKNFRVIGVFPEKGTVSSLNLDEVAIAPYTTVQNYLIGSKSFNTILVKVNSTANIERAKADITSTLRMSHNIKDPSKDDFYITTQTDIVNRLTIITTIFTMLLTSVAAISLVVGGIGIMNIMLVSVTERIQEIGLRKALGATNNDILYQFLTEAVLLTMLGGIVGIILGSVLSFGISLLMTRILGITWSFVFPVSAALIGFFVSVLVGLGFGIYPARNAASKNPIESLRYE